TSLDTPDHSVLVGTFPPPAPCTVDPRAPTNAADGTPLHDEEACVPGGLLILGSLELSGETATDAVPERPAVLPALLVDRWEVTAGRGRNALAAGLALPIAQTPVPNDGPLATSSSDAPVSHCSWSTMPLGREEYAVTCVPWEGARAFCKFSGGDLLSEA